MNQATITVTFYGDSNDNSVRQLKKKYVVKNWRDETDLRRLLDKIADEMNYISGYGIDSIAVVAEHLKFTIDYRNNYRPYKEIMDFWDSLILKVGQRGNKDIWLEIPRAHIFVFDGGKKPIQKYDAHDRLLQIRQNGNMVKVDHDNSIWSSFLYKIYGGKILFPYTTNEWTHEQPKAGKKFIAYSLSLLPSRQTTTHQFEKKRNQKKKQQHKEELDKKRCERLGIVYKNTKKKEKARQVYVIQQLDEHGFNNL